MSLPLAVLNKLNAIHISKYELESDSFWLRRVETELRSEAVVIQAL